MKNPWRSIAAPIICRVLAETAGQPEPAIRRALRGAYPWVPRDVGPYPYSVWRDEIRRQRGLTLSATVRKKQAEARKEATSLSLSLEEP